ncbi:Peptidase M [Parasponia andersonii]|uniref:Peptidase M n=1 Tax=Parasponia andersonii TaxID=3476 RepID=A0A2P5AGX6_PARAD|nr:Peptidase M [Parasponia andersonii]
MMTDGKSRILVAYHEVGHAICGSLSTMGLKGKLEGICPLTNVDAKEASIVSFPLKNSSSDAILHRNVMKPRSQDRSLKIHLSNGDTDDNIRIVRSCGSD